MTFDNRINYLNIGLMLLSCAVAFIMPFEVFLFAYAVMGPLHYLTEISWLHDRKYFTRGRYDYLVLASASVLITYHYFASRYQLWPFNNEIYRDIISSWNLGNKLLMMTLLGGFIMAFVKNIYIKLASLLISFLLANLTFMPSETGMDDQNNLAFIISAFVPTLIHVYVFTGLFMLYGALKSRSASGLLSVAVFMMCPLLLISLFRDHSFAGVSGYALNAYGQPGVPDGFFGLNQSILFHYFGMGPDLSHAATQEEANKIYSDTWINYVFHSKTGILLMRFIAFAYMYHYLNWFSKTQIIRWHQVPKLRFVVVIALWIASLVVYAFNYALGLQWLFFLSFSHVLLEFPLNAVSMAGIVKEIGAIRKNGFSIKAEKG